MTTCAMSFTVIIYWGIYTLAARTDAHTRTLAFFHFRHPSLRRGAI